LVLVGGSGKDIFVLTPKGSALIQDFKAKEDKLKISGGNGRALYSQLDISQHGRETWIEFQGQTIAKLAGASAAQVTLSLLGNRG